MSLQVVTISHDAFARFEVYRATIPAKNLYASCGCKECGGRNGFGGLFRYGTLSDGFGARPNTDKEMFCSLSCRSAYYG
jgi:hypothetical protein